MGSSSSRDIQTLRLTSLFSFTSPLAVFPTKYHSTAQPDQNEAHYYFYCDSSASRCLCLRRLLRQVLRWYHKSLSDPFTETLIPLPAPIQAVKQLQNCADIPRRCAMTMAP